MRDSPNIDTFGVSDPWELLLPGGSCSHLGVSDWRPGVTYDKRHSWLRQWYPEGHYTWWLFEN